MRYLVVGVFALFFLQSMRPMRQPIASGQGPVWDSLIHWRIYEEVNFRRALNASLDSLRFWRSEPLNDDSMHGFLRYTKKIVGVNPLFQGCYLASCEDSKGNVLKVLVSQNGDFFYSQKDKSYIELNADVRSDWLNYLRLSYLRFVK
jgi:hypothetical protein